MGGVSLLISVSAAAGGGPLGIDHKVALDESGMWSRSTQNAMLGITVTATIAAAFWEGGDTRFGKTSWYALDSELATALASTAGKAVFTRSRPSQTDDPNKWFQGKGHYSFPSGEVSAFSAAVTPYIAEYYRDNPWVWALELLPAYGAVARVKSQAHWQTDVLAGWALGAAIGYYSYKRDSPWTLGLAPHGLQVGFRTSW
jgi:undecaprenyl-diphosphatase